MSEITPDAPTGELNDEPEEVNLDTDKIKLLAVVQLIANSTVKSVAASAKYGALVDLGIANDNKEGDNAEQVYKASANMFYHVGRVMVLREIMQVIGGVELPLPDSIANLREIIEGA